MVVGELSAGNPPAKVGEPARSGCDLPALTKLREAENGKCRLITGLTRVFSLFTHARFDRSARYHLTLCASLRGHTRSHENRIFRCCVRRPCRAAPPSDWNKVDSTSGKPVATRHNQHQIPQSRLLIKPPAAFAARGCRDSFVKSSEQRLDLRSRASAASSCPRSMKISWPNLAETVNIHFTPPVEALIASPTLRR